MAHLVIKGHATRGKEVIELLEMLGANRLGLKDTFVGFYYYIECGAICSSDEYPTYSTIFTLEEFEEKYPHKVGDKVISNNTKNDISTIVSMKWDNCLCTIVYYIESTKGLHNRYYFAYELKPYKKETMEEPKELLIGFTKDSDGNWVLNTHKDYEIKEVDGKFKLIRKQPQYPKTYNECCEVLKIPDDKRYIDIYVPLDYNKLLSAFAKLLICRDAYWKIAGEEMGLDKSWEPDWTNSDFKYSIINIKDKIVYHDSYYIRELLAFPTEEMRDAFYENFKDLIEVCKEFL